MKKTDLDLYTDYLLNTFGAATATRLSAMVEGDVTHDRISRLLSQQDDTSKNLWLQVESTVRMTKHADAVLIVDDTFQENARSDESHLMCQYCDHYSGRNIKGISLLNVLYHVNAAPYTPLFNHLLIKSYRLGFRANA